MEGERIMDKTTRKRIGRPTKPPKPGERVTLGLRVTPEIKNKLEKAAMEKGRSLSQEAEFRLERSFEREALGTEVRQDVSDFLRHEMPRWEKQFVKTLASERSETFAKFSEWYAKNAKRGRREVSGEVWPSGVRSEWLGKYWKQFAQRVNRLGQEWAKLTDDDLDNISRSWEDALTQAGVDPSIPIRSFADWRRADPKWREARVAYAEYLSFLAKVFEQDEKKVVVPSTGSSPQRQGRSTSTPHTKG
jgi:hypothetical protein